MTDAVVYEQFDQTDHAVDAGAGADLDTDLRRLSDVPMELSVEIGRTRMTVGETLQLRAGSIVTLERLAGEPVDLLVNGTPIARGEVVVVDEQFGLRVTQIVEGDPPAILGSAERPESPDRTAADAAADAAQSMTAPSAAADAPAADPPAQG